MLYIDYYIIEEKEFHRRRWVGRQDDAFAGIFVAHTGIQKPALHEMCRETLNPHIDMVTSDSNLQIVFVSNLFHDIYFTSWLFWRTIM